MNHSSPDQFKLLNLKKQMAFGGTLYRKAAGRGLRPIESKSKLHVVLKSDKATGDWNFRHPSHREDLFKIIHRHSRECGVKVSDLAIQTNHIHLIISFKRRSYYFRWIKRVTAAIAFRVTGWNKFKKTKLKFWTLRPFTRIIRTLKHYSIAKDYVALNMLEAIGMIRWQQKRLSGLTEKESKILKLSLTG